MDGSQIAEMVTEFADIGAQIHGSGSNGEALHRIPELAVKHVPGCAWASITLIDHIRPRTIASSDPVAARADELQYELGEGPCVQAAATDRDVLMVGVNSETRWPRYAEALARTTPIRSIMSMQLPAEQAALNLYADHDAAYDDTAIDVAAVLAAHTSSAVALYLTENHSAHLQRALESSRQIGMALGILMAHHKVTQEDAFDLLRVASQNLHVKLRDLALDVIETGTVPDVPKGN